MKSDAGDGGPARRRRRRPTFDSFEETPFDAAVVAFEIGVPSPGLFVRGGRRRVRGRMSSRWRRRGSGKTLAFLLPMFHGMKRRGDVEGLSSPDARVSDSNSGGVQFGAEHGFQAWWCTGARARTSKKTRCERKSRASSSVRRGD